MSGDADKHQEKLIDAARRQVHGRDQPARIEVNAETVEAQPVDVASARAANHENHD